jgi:hypothetical protein
MAVTARSEQHSLGNNECGDDNCHDNCHTTTATMLRGQDGEARMVRTGMARTGTMRTGVWTGMARTRKVR